MNIACPAIGYALQVDTMVSLVVMSAWRATKAFSKEEWPCQRD